MSEPLRIGFAGLGEAATLVLPEIAQLPYIRVVAAADLRDAALESFEREFRGRAYRSVEELCADAEVDAIYVATPHELHTPHTLLALRAGKHVIVEKPMAVSMEAAEEMNRTAERLGLKLLCGHTKSFDPPMRKLRQMIRSGEYGPLRMINSWNYNDFMVRPYPDSFLTPHGVVMNQGPHQVDCIRLLGGGLVRSVRAATGAWDGRSPEGMYSCFLEFEGGAVASFMFSGYGFFDTAELTWWLGEGAYPGKNQESRRGFNGIRGPDQDATLERMKDRTRYGASPSDVPRFNGWNQRPDMSHTAGHQRFYGLTVVSCERAEMRQSQDGIIVYGDGWVREEPIEPMLFGRQAEVTELYEAVTTGRPMFHDGRWGQATLEVCWAIVESAAQHREITMLRQTPVGD
jgi:phthalate 4,5-cis-dihydrodiol dehydrogenase